MKPPINLDEYRDNLRNKTIKVLKDHPPFSPILRLIELNGKKVVWKDYAQRSFWVKNIWGKILINRECCILKRLKGIKGVPRLINQIDDYGFILEYLESEPLDKFRPETMPFSVFDSLSRLVKEIHRRGIVHLDLGQRRNILLDKNHSTYFVDFANALYFRTTAFGFRQLFNFLCLIDHNALLKFKHRFFPQALTSSEKRILKWFFFTRKFWVFKPKKYRPKDRVR